MEKAMVTDVENKILGSLNEEQRAAVLDIDNPCLVLAGAGTGKTTTLTHKVAYVLTADKEVYPSQVVLLTFTKTAAEEMIRRAKKLTERAKEIIGGTFHSFAYQELKKIKCKKGQKLYVLDEEDQERVFKIVMETNKNDKSKTSISKHDNFTLTVDINAEIAAKIYNYLVESGEKIVDAYLALVCSRKIEEKRFVIQYDNLEMTLTDFIEMDKSNIEIAEQLLNKIFRDIYEKYNSYKETKNLFDFSDILLHFYHALRNKEIILDIKYLFVDEYQDVSNLQANIVLELAKICENRVTVVGDDAQSIYGFRAANYKNIVSFKDLIPGCRVYKITQNYRSTQEILNLANYVLNSKARYLKESPYLRKNLFSNVNGKLPVLVQVNYTGQITSLFYNDKVVDIVVSELTRHNIPFDRAAILCRSSYMLDRLEIALAKRNIEYFKMGGISIFERGFVKDFIALLSFISEMPNSEISFYRIVEHIKGVGEKIAHKMYQVLTDGGYYSFSNLESFLLNAKNIKNAELAIRFVSKLGEIYFAYKNQLESLENILSSLRFFYFSEMYPNSMSSQQIRIIDYIVSQIAEIGDISQFLEEVAFRDNHKNIKGKFVLATVHAAKGLEWEAVFLVNLFDYAFPPKSTFYVTRPEFRAEAMDEELRLLYVALTRAKNFLYIIKPLHNSSSFLDDIEYNLVRKVIV